MTITKNQIDDLNLQLTLDIAAADYADAEKKKINEIRKSADIRGFRKGMAPASLISRMYGSRVLAEAVNDIINDQLNTYIKDNNLRVVGEPLASEEQPVNEWVSGKDFSFKFDIATIASADFELTEKDKVAYYEIEVTDLAKDEMKKNMLNQTGKLEDAAEAGEDDFVTADLSNGEKTVEAAYISVRNVEGEARKKFVGAKVGDEFSFNVNEAFSNETDRSALLKVKKEELADLNPLFNAVVKTVRTFVPAAENQETFDRLFGPDKVHDAAEFDAAVEERLKDNYTQEADYRQSKDIRDYLVKKADVKLPEEFLKRWLLHINEGKFTKEDIEKEFASFAESYRWQIVREGLMDKFGLKVEDKDIEEAAEAYVSYQYAMYGMGNVPAELIRDAANNLLKDRNQVQRLVENVEDNKVITQVRGTIGRKVKKISVEDFRKLK